jgi:hypothetical protein
MDTTNTVELSGKIYDITSGKALGPSLVPKKANSAHAAPYAKAVHRKTQHATTLMRSSVKIPKAAAHKPLPTKATVQIMDAILPTHLAQERFDRSKAIAKSRLISRFNDIADQSKLVKKIAVLAVRVEPIAEITHHHVPVMNQPPILSKPIDIFATAMNDATSHTQKHKQSSKHLNKAARKLGVSSKVLAVSSSVLLVSLLVGFYAYQNAPNAAFRVAAAQAGIRASLPGYKPSGFAMKGPVQTAPGEISVRYQSNADDRSYTLSQKTSSWDSAALLENYVATSRRDYQIMHEAGRTVYIYNHSSATWVDGGIWYQIEGDSSLSSDQLLHIASSM